MGGYGAAALELTNQQSNSECYTKMNKKSLYAGCQAAAEQATDGEARMKQLTPIN